MIAPYAHALPPPFPEQYQILAADRSALEYAGGTIDFVQWLKWQATTDISLRKYLFGVDQTSNVTTVEGLGNVHVEAAWKAVEDGTSSIDHFLGQVQRHARIFGHANTFEEAIQIALQHEAIRAARRLVEIGLQNYPESDGLKRYERALAPPKLISRTPATHNYSKSMRWLSAHSHEYVGQWLALQDGVLLGTAQSRQALSEQLGARIEQDDVLITRIPSS